MKILSKEKFCYILSQIEKQLDKDRRLIDFLNTEYLDGHSVSTISNDSIDCIIKLLAYQFEGDSVFNKTCENWVDWFVWENGCGRKNMSCYLYPDGGTSNRIEYPISSAEVFYDFLLEWMKIK